MRIRFFNSEREAERLIAHLESVGVEASLEGLTPKEKSIWGRTGASKDKVLSQGFYICKVVMPMIANSWQTKTQVEDPELKAEAKALMKERYRFDLGGSIG